MKFLKQLSLFALLAVLAFASCKKDELFIQEGPDEVTPTEHHVNGLISRSTSSAEGLDLGCVSIDYPFQMILLDSSIIDIASEDDFLNALSDETNPPLDFVYPLNITDQDGNSLTVADTEALADAFADCIPNMGWDDDFPEWFFPAWVISYEYSCYQLVYPVTLLDMDSMAITVSDENELVSYLADGNLYSFAFPLNLEDEDGNPATAADQGELFDLLAQCSPEPGPGGCGIGTFGCYQLGYPATLLLVDGSTVVVNDDDEFAEVVFSGEWAGFEYPLTLIDEDGNSIVVNNEEELNEAMFDCAGFGGDPNFELGDLLCYDIVFPFSINDLMTGITITFNNSAEWNDYQYGNPNGPNPFEFVYPITLIHVETGQEITLNDEGDMDDAFSACFGSGWGGGDPNVEFGDFVCYDFVYPFSVENLTNGATTTFNNEQEWLDYQFGNPNGNGPEPFQFVYPLSLTHVESGAVTTVDSEEEMFDALEECW
ncbi:MAG: hypothetical protein R2788_00580 [Saprospiraceae bacterium]